MTTKDIIFLKSVDPVEIIDKPSDYTVEVVSKIIASKDFLFYKNIFQKALNFPENGIDIKPFVGIPLFKILTTTYPNAMAAFQVGAFPFKAELGMTDDLIFQLILLFGFNAVIDLKYFKGFVFQPIRFILGKENIASAMFRYPYEVGAILIPYNISQKKLYAWIKSNWNSINKQMDDNLTVNPFLNQLHKNFEIALEIINLKDHQGKSFLEITDILTNKYPDDLRIVDGEWVKKTYRDNKKYLNIKPQRPKSK